MNTLRAIFVIACVICSGCSTSPQPQTRNKQTEPKLRVFFQQPTTAITPTGDPEKDCPNWALSAGVYSAYTGAGHISYADCDYNGDWDMFSSNGEFRVIYKISTKTTLDRKVKEKLEMTARTFAGFLDSDKDIVRGKGNGTVNICVPNPNNPHLKICGDDSYVLRGSEAARPYDQQYRLFVETYKLQMEAESPPSRR